MGWGQEPHEGYNDEKRPDGTWSGPVHRGGDPDPVAYQAVCGCGWRSEREHPIPPRPLDLPKDERGVAYGPEYDAWIKQLEEADELCYEDWRVDHFDPLLGYEPHTHSWSSGAATAARGTTSTVGQSAPAAAWSC